MKPGWWRWIRYGQFQTKSFSDPELVVAISLVWYTYIIVNANNLVYTCMFCFCTFEWRYLDANEIRFITRECFQHLTNLRILNIAGNNVLTVEDGAFASNSQVDDLCVLVNVLDLYIFIKLLYYLLHRYLDGNEIQFVRLETFTGLSRLQRL